MTTPFILLDQILVAVGGRINGDPVYSLSK